MSRTLGMNRRENSSRQANPGLAILRLEQPQLLWLSLVFSTVGAGLLLFDLVENHVEGHIKHLLGVRSGCVFPEHLYS
jgi:hypothetical protein